MRQLRTLMTRREIIFGILALAAGCETVDQTQTFEESDTETVVLVVMDLSPSFAPKMIDGGEGFDLIMQIVDEYYKSRTGTGDQIMLAQISGEKKAALWQGTPEELQNKWSDPTAFRDFLLQNSISSYSPVNESIAHAIEVMRMNRCMASGKAKSVVIVISDMIDTGKDTAGTEKRLMNVFVDYLRSGGVIGLYHVDQFEMKKWHANFKAAGFDLVSIEGEHNGKPQLPRLVH